LSRCGEGEQGGEGFQLLLMMCPKQYLRFSSDQLGWAYPQV